MTAADFDLQTTFDLIDKHRAALEASDTPDVAETLGTTPEEVALLRDIWHALRTIATKHEDAARRLATIAAEIWVDHVRNDPATYQIAVAKRFDIGTIGGARNVRAAASRLFTGEHDHRILKGEVIDALEHVGHTFTPFDDDYTMAVALIESRAFHVMIEDIANEMWRNR